MVGQITTTCEALLSVKRQLLAYPSTLQRSLNIGQITKAWVEANKALRLLGYLAEEQEIDSGQAETLEGSND